MDIRGSRRMLFGERMSDKNNPKYKERYERDMDARQRFAKATRIDETVTKVQGFTNAYQTLSLVVVFGFTICRLTRNIYRLAVVYRHHPTRRTATGMWNSTLREWHKTLSVSHV